jgi:hypothetical protein
MCPHSQSVPPSHIPSHPPALCACLAHPDLCPRCRLLRPLLWRAAPAGSAAARSRAKPGAASARCSAAARLRASLPHLLQPRRLLQQLSTCLRVTRRTCCPSMGWSCLLACWAPAGAISSCLMALPLPLCSVRVSARALAYFAACSACAHVLAGQGRTALGAVPMAVLLCLCRAGPCMQH